MCWGDCMSVNVVVFVEDEWVWSRIKGCLKNVPPCWELEVSDVRGTPLFVEIANNMDWFRKLQDKDKRVFDGVPINTCPGSMYIYRWGEDIPGSAIGCCADGAYSIGVRATDSSVSIVNRITHELIHGIDHNGKCNPDCMLKIDPSKWLVGWQIKAFNMTGDPDNLLKLYPKGSIKRWLVWIFRDWLVNYWQKKFYAYLIDKYIRGACDAGDT